MRKKLLASLCLAMMVTGLVAGCGAKEEVAPVEEPVVEEVAEPVEEAPVAEEPSAKLEDVTVRVGAMSGPTAMGMVKLMEDAAYRQTAINFEFAELATEASAFVAPLAKGELDIACVPSNLASVIYNNTEGKVVVLATCNQGVLYVVERGESISSLADLAGKDVYMTGQGAVPEATVRYLLTENGLDPDADVNLTFCADTTEALSYVAKDEAAVAVLPQPFVIAACAQVEGLRVAIDLNEQWNALNNGCNIITGVVVARKDFVEQNPNTVAEFIDEYKASVDYVVSNPAEASVLVEQYGIVAKAAVAEKAIPKCNLVALTGDELKTSLSGFLQILYDANPQSVGGTLPADDFYYAN